MRPSRTRGITAEKTIAPSLASTHAGNDLRAETAPLAAALRTAGIGDRGKMIVERLQRENLQRGIGEQTRLHAYDGSPWQLQVAMQQIRRRNRIDFQFERCREIGLQGKRQRPHHRIGRFLIIRAAHEQRAAGLGDKVEQPLGHFLVKRGKHRQQIVLASLFEKGLERIDGIIGVAMVMATGVDEVDEITREGIRTRPG